VDVVRRVQTHTSGGMPFHYSPWRLKHCVLNARLFEATKAIWKETWAVNAPGFECGHGAFDAGVGYAFIDSVNFRLPSRILVDRYQNVQKTIGPHMDINPWDKWGGRKGNVRWRPFQGFIALTDHEGGFMCCPGFHLQLDDYFSRIPQPAGHTKGYVSLYGKEYRDIHARMRQIHYNPGDAVIWDWRLPHRITEDHPGTEPREVVYTSFFPDIPLNRRYVENQLEAMKTGKYPPEFSRDENRDTIVPGWDPAVFNSFSTIEKQLLGICPWN